MNVKTRITPQGKTIFILTGADITNEIAAFPGLLQAALVARYISGGDMPEADQRNALAALSEYDSCLEKGIVHHEAGGEEWAE